MPRITIDYLIPATLEVDTDTGEVLHMTMHYDGFQSTDEVRVFTGYVDDDDGNPLDEYLPLDHPLSERALEIADTVRVSFVGGSTLVPFQTGPNGNPTFGAILGAPGEDRASGVAVRHADCWSLFNEASDRYEEAYEQRRQEKARERKLSSQRPGPSSRPSGFARDDR